MNRPRALLTAVAVLALTMPTACALLLPLPEPAEPICGRLEPEDCDAAIELVRETDPAAFAGNPVPVVEFVCGPGQRCEAGYETLVVLVHPGWNDIADLTIFNVAGTQGPEQAVPYLGDVLPGHIIELLPTQ